MCHNEGRAGGQQKSHDVSLGSLCKPERDALKQHAQSPAGASPTSKTPGRRSGRWCFRAEAGRIEAMALEC